LNKFYEYSTKQIPNGKHSLSVLFKLNKYQSRSSPLCNVASAVDVSVGCDATARSFCVDFWDIF